MTHTMQDLAEVVEQIIEDWQTESKGFTTDMISRLNEYLRAHCVPCGGASAYIVFHRQSHQPPLYSTYDFSDLSYFDIESNTHGSFWLVDPETREPIDLHNQGQEANLCRRFMRPGDNIITGFIELRVQQVKSLLYAKNLPAGDCDESRVFLP